MSANTDQNNTNMEGRLEPVHTAEPIHTGTEEHHHHHRRESHGSHEGEHGIKKILHKVEEKLHPYNVEVEVSIRFHLADWSEGEKEHELALMRLFQ